MIQSSRAPLFIFSLTAAYLSLSGCSRKAPPEPSAAEGKRPVEQPAPDPPDEVVHIPIGEFTIGSDPGEPGRHPSLEPLSTKLRLGPFRIDSQLVRTKEGKPRLGVSRDEASTICAQKQGRLCSEAEWERACRGASSSLYPSGETPCSLGESCRSGFDTLEMTQYFEWTASHFGKASEQHTAPVVRGASREQEPNEKRCATRRFPSPKKEQGAAPAAQIGFRCCYGAPNAAAIKEPTLEAPYEETQLSLEELRALLKEDPRTRPLAAEAKFFKEDAAATVLARGPGDTKGFQLTTSPVIWHPGPGSSYLIITAHDSKRTSFVLAYFESATKRKLAGSFIMKNEPGPIALAYASSIRPRIHFSGCWGCPGETGKVLFREPEELVFLQP